MLANLDVAYPRYRLGMCKHPSVLATDFAPRVTTVMSEDTYPLQAYPYTHFCMSKFTRVSLMIEICSGVERGSLHSKGRVDSFRTP